jgi:hypothetical protein
VLRSSRRVRKCDEYVRELKQAELAEMIPAHQELVAERRDPGSAEPTWRRHALCALAVVSSGGKLGVVCDLRHPAPPRTQLTSLFHLGGDGQVARPGQDLPEPLRVGVANGQRPVRGARVEFRLLDSGAVLKTEDGSPAPNPLRVVTRADGVAACRWRLDPEPANRGQVVEAVLLDTEDNARPCSPAPQGPLPRQPERGERGGVR